MSSVDVLMIDQTHSAQHPQVQRRKAIRRKLRLSMLFWTAGIAMLAVGFCALARITTPTRHTNPLAEYADFFPGQSESVVIERGFACDPDPTTGGHMVCRDTPVGGVFERISAELQNHVVMETTFVVRTGALMVGDMPLEWGRPRALRVGESLRVYWPLLRPGVVAVVDGSQFSFFDPVTRLIISRH
jgi:hypothetical protein